MSQFIEMFGYKSPNAKMSSVSTIVSGKSIPKDLEDTKGPLAYVKVADFNIDGNEKCITTSSRFVTTDNAKLSVCIPVGSVIFAKNGAASLSNKKRITVIECCIDMNTMAIIPKDNILSEFLYSIVCSIDISRYVRQGAIPSISPKSIENICFYLPPIEEQERFVCMVEQADKSKFGDFKSQFIEMFGDPMTNTKVWVEFGYIGNYTQIVLGSTPNSKNSFYWNGDIKWITPAEMVEESFYIYDTERHLTEEGLKASNLTLLPYRSVLFSTRAPIGKVGLVGSPMYCNQGFKNFVCGDKLNPVYLYYSLIFKREYLVSLGTGTTFKELSKKVVENLKIAVPPLILQNKFEMIYQQADNSKSVIQKALVYLNDIQSDELGKIA